MISEGFNWEEINTGKTGRQTHSDIYIGSSHGKAEAILITARLGDKTGMVKGETWKLYAQGKAIFMLKREKGETKISSANSYLRFGGKQAAVELYTRAGTTEFEIVDSEDGCVIFRPIR